MDFAHFRFDPSTDRLGEGPQSEVFRAVDTRLGRTVALKILRPQVEFDPEAVTRFAREAQHASRLEHPNIATVYEYGSDQSRSYMAMEYLVGRTLDRVVAERVLPYEQGARIACEVASALESVHSLGLIHRDLKPANIMVLEDGGVKLLDFGICRSTAENTITQEGILVGTVLYMSPEQVRGHDLDLRSDVFAFGSTFYHAFTGELPFPGRSFPQVCMAILDGRPRRPSDVRSGFPAVLEDALLRCLAPQPSDRYPSGEALHSAFISVHQSLASQSTSRTSTRLRGRIFVPRFDVAGKNEGERAFAAGLRHDLRSELERSTGLDIVLLEAGEPLPASGRSQYRLRGSLELRAQTGVVNVELAPLGGGAQEAVQHRIEYTDADEWGLQAQLVRGLSRVVRNYLSDVAQKPSAAIKRDTALAGTLARHAHDVLHRGTSKHLVAAISSFRHAIDADPQCSLAHAGLAEALVRKYVYWDGDRTFLDEALEEARRALVLDPASAEGHTSLGFAHAMSGHPEDALREYRLAIQADQKEWLAHRLLGALLARQGNDKAASPLLRRAIALQPTHIGSYDHLYHVLGRLGRYEEGLEIADFGISHARAHLREVPDSQEARLHLALLLARMGSVDEARKEVDQARELTPRDGYTQFHAGCVLAILGHRQEAIRALVEARDRGYFLRSELFNNDDLDSLRDLPEFADLAR
jgi:serine/threonine protein kinase/Flp pilus assembly protein TadD